jgi:hypothetical protein
VQQPGPVDELLDREVGAVDQDRVGVHLAERGDGVGTFERALGPQAQETLHKIDHGSSVSQCGRRGQTRSSTPPWRRPEQLAYLAGA